MRESHAARSVRRLRRVPTWVLVMAVPVVAVIAMFITDVLSGGDIGGNHRDRVTEERAGTYAYHCEIHPFMTGTVRVSP